MINRCLFNALCYLCCYWNKFHLPSLLKPIIRCEQHKWYSKSVCIYYVSAKNHFYAFQNERTNVQTISIWVTEFHAPSNLFHCCCCCFFFVDYSNEEWNKKKRPHTINFRNENGKFKHAWIMPNSTQLVSFLKRSTFVRISILLDLMSELSCHGIQCCRIVVRLTHPLCLFISSVVSVYLCLIQWITTTMPKKMTFEFSHLDPENDWFSNLHTNILNPTVRIHILSTVKYHLRCNRIKMFIELTSHKSFKPYMILYMPAEMPAQMMVGSCLFLSLSLSKAWQIVRGVIRF